MPDVPPAPALQSPYEPPGANEPLVLYDGPIRAQGREFDQAGPGRVQYAWHPQPQLEFTLDVNSLGPQAPLGQVRVALAGKGVSVVGEFTLAETSLGHEGARSHYYGRLTPPLLAYAPNFALDAPVATKVLFHAVNLPQCTALAPPEVIQTEQVSWVGRTVLGANGWALTLDQRPDWRAIRKGLHAHGGHAITHLGTIARQDAAPFSARDGYSVLGALSLYVSFLRGGWSSVIFPVGLGPDGQVVFEGWSGVAEFNGGRLTAWGEDAEHERHLDLGNDRVGFAAYLRLRNSSVWGTPIESALRWCVETDALSSGVQGSIILQATALELLGWTIFTQDPTTKRYSPSVFNKLNHEKRLALLVDWLGATRSVNEFLYPNLNALTREGESKKDAPRVLSQIRHAYVHPKPSRARFLAEVSPDALLEAHRLGQIYLRQAIRKLLGYPPFVPDARPT